jgi:hypothetical protein
MDILPDIIKIIELYYPENITFNDPKYKSSLQYMRLLKTREKQLANQVRINEFQNQLKKISSGYEVINWTDLKSNNCYEYRILLHKNQSSLDDDVELIKALNGKRQDLYLFTSILSSYYYFFVNETLYDEFASEQWKFRRIFKFSQDIQSLIDNLQKFMEKEGFMEIKDEVAKENIENVETEFLEQGEVKIFNCLFTELITID